MHRRDGGGRDVRLVVGGDEPLGQYVNSGLSDASLEVPKSSSL